MIIIIGTKNKRCLISSYKFTFNRIKNNNIDNKDIDNEPNNINSNLFMNNFFSIMGNNKIPIKIMIGNLKKSQIGMYEEGRFCAFLQVPRVIVQTVCM